MRVSVEDDGEGMSGKVRARIFEPFFTTKADGQGSGLGLPVIQDIIRDHGGTIHVESAAPLRKAQPPRKRLLLPPHVADRAS